MANRVTLKRMIQSVAAAELTAASDRVLLERFADHGDQAAFAALIQRHTPMVLGVCHRALANRQDAEDACQAVFLVLVRRAKGGRWQTSIANWLHATARKVAGNARVSAQRRTRREGRAAVAEAVRPVDHITGRELLDLLDEEMERLPARYREPLMLCCLEGLTRDEAAARLGIPVGTLKIRLERGRKRLGERLTLRGCTLGAGLLALAATSPAGASPLRLGEAILASASGSPPPAVAALVEEVAMNGLIRKSMLAAAALVGIVALGLGTGSAPRTAANPLPGPPKAEAAASENPPVPPKDRAVVRGRVLRPDGKPAANAAVYLRERDQLGKSVKETKITTTGPDGRFEAVPSDWSSVVVVADGYAPDWASADARDGELTLTLAEDVPLRGRLVDLQGRPVAGARVRTLAIHAAADGDLKPAYAAFRLNPEWTWRTLPLSLNDGTANRLPAATTDATGAFELRGVGKNRVAEIRFDADGIESARAVVFADQTFDHKLVAASPGERSQNAFAPDYHPAVYGPTFTHAAKPCHVIVGTVTDAETGKPIAGVKVVGTAAPIGQFRNDAWHDAVEATTDAAGRYRLNGLPKAKQRFLHVQSGEAPYLDQVVTVPDVQALVPASADVTMHRAAVVEGRLLDRKTGKPVTGEVYYLAMTGNPWLKRLPGIAVYTNEVTVRPRPAHTYTDDAGRFALRVLPGPGVILARADMFRNPEASYTSAIVAEADRKYLRKPSPDARSVGPTRPRGEEYFDTGTFVAPLHWENGYALIAPEATDRTTNVDIRFDPGLSVSGRVVGPDGKPLAGAKVVGLGGKDLRPATLPTDAFTAHALSSGQPRTLFLVHEERKLVGTVAVQAGDKELIARLVPWASVTGRVLDHDGKPAAGAEVWFQMSKGTEDEFIRTKLYRRHETIRTDTDGRFRLDGLFPGCELTVFVNKPGHRSGISFRPVAPKDNEIVDLGDVKFPDPKKADGPP